MGNPDLEHTPRPQIGVQAEEHVAQRPRLLPRVFYGWYIVAAGMGVHLWMSISWVYGMQLFFTPITTHFGWSRAIVSGAFGLQRLEGSIISPILGFMVDRFGPRNIVLLGAVTIGLGLISLSFMQTIWMFYASVMVVSIGMSATVGIPRTWAIVQWFRRLRGRALGIGASGAVISGPLLIIIVWLLQTFGWRTSFVILGVATWFICIPLSFVFRSRPQQYGYLPDGDPPKNEAEEAPRPESRRRGRSSEDVREVSLTVRQALQSRAFWVLTLVFSAQTLGVNGLNIHLIPYFESIGYSPAKAASVLAIYTVLSIFGRLGGGWAIDFFDRRLILAVLLACQATSLLILSNITSYWQVIPFALLYGTAFGGMMPSRGVIVSTYFGTRSFGAIQGLTQSGTVLAGMVGPVLMGWVFDVTDSYKLSLYILMGVAAVAIPLPFFARQPRLPVESAR